MNLKNNKVIGLHKGTPDEPKNFNYGTLLKYPLNDFINKTKNVIKGEIYVGKDKILMKIFKLLILLKILKESKNGKIINMIINMRMKKK